MIAESWLTAVAAASVLFVLLLVGLLVWWWRRRRQGLRRILKERTWGHLRDVVIPDGMDGQIHLDRVLLTRRGLIVLESRQLRGAVFGAEKMSEWVMLDRGRRFGFGNPLPSLDERVEALRHFASGVRVEGYILIEGTVDFPKGRPARTLLADDLADKLEPVSGSVPDGWRALWGKLGGHARES